MLEDEGFDEFILDIFQLSGINNVENCYQQTKL
jgi:hypothetical protein